VSRSKGHALNLLPCNSVAEISAGSAMLSHDF
jgi:hypothetical protein